MPDRPRRARQGPQVRHPRHGPLRRQEEGRHQGPRRYVLLFQFLFFIFLIRFLNHKCFRHKQRLNKLIFNSFFDFIFLIENRHQPLHQGALRLQGQARPQGCQGLRG